MIRALLFGGAFNPPTNAHIELADQARKAVGAQYVIFVLSKQTYIADTQKKDGVFSDEMRLAMMKKIAENHPWMIVSDYELLQETQPRTYQTLCHYQQQGYDVSLLFGSDKLPELEHGWRHVEEIARECGIVCMKRANQDVEAMIASDAYLCRLEPYITIVETSSELQMVSSTLVRKLLKEEGYAGAKAYIPVELEEFFNDSESYDCNRSGSTIA